jgi:hypothetical protein
MLRRREQLLTEMAKEVCQATEEVLTIVNTSWEPADCRGMRDRLRAGVRFRTIFDRSSLDHAPHREWVRPGRRTRVRGPGRRPRRDPVPAGRPVA